MLRSLDVVNIVFPSSLVVKSVLAGYKTNSLWTRLVETAILAIVFLWIHDFPIFPQMNAA